MTTVQELGFDGGRLARLPARIDGDIAAGRYHGAALRVTRHGEPVYAGVHGYADAAHQRPLRAEDVFVSFSIGKQFTNVMVLNRVEQGLLHLDMNIGDVIPGFRGRGKRHMKLWHLLSHTSGILSAIPAVPPEVMTSVHRLTEHVASLRPDTLPGEKVNYSIIAAHAVLGELLCRVDGAGRGIARILAEDLFQPLGMTDTCLGPRPDLVARLCPVSTCYDEPGMFHPAEVAAVGAVVMMEGCEIPAGGFLTTIADVDRFARMLRGGGALDGVRLLAPATLTYCTRNFTGDRPNGLFDYALDTRGWPAWPANIGLGFFVRGEGVLPGPMSNFSSPRAFAGWGAGSTCFWVDPEFDLTFSFLSTGLMEETYHIERLQRLADLVLTSIVD